MMCRAFLSAVLLVLGLGPIHAQQPEYAELLNDCLSEGRLLVDCAHDAALVIGSEELEVTQKFDLATVPTESLEKEVKVCEWKDNIKRCEIYDCEESQTLQMSICTLVGSCSNAVLSKRC